MTHLCLLLRNVRGKFQNQLQSFALNNRRSRSRYFNKLVETDHYRTYKVVQKTGVVGFFSGHLSDVLVNSARKLFPSAFVTMDLVPPEAVRGMKVLDRECFKRKVLLPTLKVPFASIPNISKHFKKDLCKITGVKPIVCLADDDPEKDTGKLVILNPSQYKCKSDLSGETEAFLIANKVSLDSFNLHEIELGYSNWGHVDILKAVLPVESEGVAGFSAVGHIIHLNLRHEVMEYKQLIGDVLLDKIPTARTVVNKLNTIDNTYRNFQMEVIAGDEDFVVCTRENGHRFQFDFSKVYWNPRLATEHQRLVDLMQPGDVLYDVFAGVGPFAVPAARKKCIVIANDLNPESFKWLQHNMTLNKVKVEYHTHNLDGRDFIRTVIRQSLLARWQQDGESAAACHVIMNLPALALDFLDAFSGLLHDKLQQPQNVPLPRIHCHCFSKSDHPEEDVRQRAAECMGHPMNNCTVHDVRDVAPNKQMMCVSFDLTWDILHAAVEDTEPPEKKPKTD